VAFTSLWNLLVNAQSALFLLSHRERRNLGELARKWCVDCHLRFDVLFKAVKLTVAFLHSPRIAVFCALHGEVSRPTRVKLYLVYKANDLSKRKEIGQIAGIIVGRGKFGACSTCKEVSITAAFPAYFIGMRQSRPTLYIMTS